MAVGLGSHPILYALNLRVRLHELSRDLGRAAALRDLPDEELDRFRDLGIDLVWPIGVWPTGPRSIEVARAHPGLQAAYRTALPDFTPADVIGSPYAVAAYTADPSIGGPAGLADFRRRLDTRDIGLVLDFVVNHTGLDHPWLRAHPEYYVQGCPDDLRDAPEWFFEAETDRGPRVFAHGRDPYFPSWTDTAQLNLLHPAARAALRATLADVADQCDAVRCDMAMLVLESVFRQTWGERALSTVEGPPAGGDFWDDAIRSVLDRHEDFIFIAEAYWGLEDRLRTLGFRYTYDKTLYDRLAWGTAGEIRQHLQADPDWQRGCVRFLENHDELRAAAVFPWDRHKAAAVLTATVPGMLLLHDGQLEGRTVRLPIQLRRRPPEPVNGEIQSFYERLLKAVAGAEALERGVWSLLPVRAAQADDPTWEDVLACQWRAGDAEAMLVVVNYGPRPGRCRIDVDGASGEGSDPVLLRDLLDDHGEPARLYAEGEPGQGGLCLELRGFACHLFRAEPRAREAG